MESITEAKRIRTIAHDTPSISTFIASNVYLPQLVALLEDEDDEAVAIALEVINFLVSESNAANRRRIASEKNLLSRVQEMMMDISLDAKVKSHAIKTYTNLQAYQSSGSSDELTTSTPSVAASTKEVDADVINEEFPNQQEENKPAASAVPQGGPTMSIFRTAAAGPAGRSATVGFGGLGALSSNQSANTAQSSGAAPGLALFSSSVSNRLATAQTFTVFVKGLQNRPDNKAALEKKLLSVKGVISFSIFEEKAVVRAIISEQELLKSVREITGLQVASSMPGLDDKENSSPQYLQRERTRDAGNKGKIVVQDYNKDKGDDAAANGWFGRVARALWG